MRTTGTSRTARRGAITGGVLASLVALTAAACGSSASSAPAASGASPSHHAMAHHAMAETARFGSDCGMVPATGMGSFHGMSMDPVVTAAAHNPLLTTLAKIIKYHVVSGHVTPAQLASGKPLTTLEGGTLKPSKMGAVYEVNTADVICGNIQTANATVYVINKVLIPM